MYLGRNPPLVTCVGEGLDQRRDGITHRSRMQAMKEEGRERYFGPNVALFSEAAGGSVDKCF